MILLDIFGQNPIQGPGTGTFTEHLFEIVAMLVVAFLLGLWLGRIAVAKWRKKGKDAETELSHLKAEAIGIEDKKLEINTLQEKIKILEDKNSRLRMESSKPVVNQANAVLEAKLQTQEQLISQLKGDLEMSRQREADFNASLNTANVIKGEEITSAKVSKAKAEKVKSEPLVTATATPKQKAKNKSKAKGKSKSKDGDDLKKIEGVGPKIEQLLNNDGIKSYKDVIASGAESIKTILLKAGPQYKVHDPSTWGEQAQLALDEKWDELHEMQAQLKGGKKV